MRRRDFIKSALVAGAALQFPDFWIKKAFAEDRRFKMTILQTNDTHSRIDPFPMDGGRDQGQGGIARRATLVKKFRQENPHTLLLDGGDVLQGTPYFNMYKGRIEYETMSRCGYDATTLGNHEFDNGVDMLAKALGYCNFDVLNCNYELGSTALAKIVKPYITRQVGPIKVGITGVGIDFKDLVAPKNHIGVEYTEPYPAVQKVVNTLRSDLGCQFVVVLSHLGYRAGNNHPGDTGMAKKVDGIDWIVGAHTHTFMKKPDVIISDGGYTTRILQVGFAGILLGKTDFYFEEGKLTAVNSQNITIDHTVDERERVGLSA